MMARANLGAALFTDKALERNAVLLIVLALCIALIVIGAVLIVSIGAGRIVLNVHHPSDVLAGWALGYVWFVVCLLSVPPTAPITATDETLAVPDTSR